MNYTLPELCSYLCGIQSKVLSSSTSSLVFNDDYSTEVFYKYWDEFLTKTFIFIRNLINHYSKDLSEILNKLSQLNLKNIKESENVNNSILDACEEYEKYILLIYQIKLDIDYLDTGIINCLGHKKETLIYYATMNRSTNLN